MLIRLLASVLFLSLLLHAGQKEYEAKILSTIAQALFPDKQELKVWADTQKYALFLQEISHITTVSSMEKADILFITKRRDIQNKKMKFVTSYTLLKRYKKSALGGFYWKKGRPNILFIEKNLLKYHKTLPASMHKYIESDL